MTNPEAMASRKSGSKAYWLRLRPRHGHAYFELKRLMRDLSLHTACEEAFCTNLWGCWEARAATFMIFGNIRTRRRAFCAVPQGRPCGVLGALVTDRAATVGK